MSTLPEHFLFRLQFSAAKTEADPQKLTPETLSANYRIPFIVRYPLPASSENTVPDFDFRFGWHERGLFLTAILSGKQRPPICEQTHAETSDAISFFFDSRDVRDVHRASKFCHRFLFLPTETEIKGGNGKPIPFWLPIHRAKAHPNRIDTARFTLASEVRPNGWSLSVFMPSDTLTGYDPNEHARVGIWFSLFDNELGRFRLQHSPAFPAEEDPSLWSAVDLV